MLIQGRPGYFARDALALSNEAANASHVKSTVPGSISQPARCLASTAAAGVEVTTRFSVMTALPLVADLLGLLTSTLKLANRTKSAHSFEIAHRLEDGLSTRLLWYRS